MADAIPHAVLSEQLEAHLAGRRLLAGVFLTFEFDPHFFELEVLPVVIGLAGSHDPVLRRIQLEDGLRPCAGKVAVYYDADRLVWGQSGSARLDIERIPVRCAAGVFHAKNILLLVEETGGDPAVRPRRSLLVASLSANLTRSGWWENVECCHFEEIGEGDASLLKEDVRRLLRNLQQRTAPGLRHRAAEALLDFLPGVVQRIRHSSGGRLLPHFYSGGPSFPEFLEGACGDRLRGACLEVLSPFFDDAATCEPLAALIERFRPREVRVMLPRARDGQAGCRRDLYEAVRGLPGVTWGTLPATAVKSGRHGGDGTEGRFVHAKLYRFFTVRPKREWCFVGSVNLTSAAHHGRRNWETGFLVEVACPGTPAFWLEEEKARPTGFESGREEEGEVSGGTPLMLRYHWDRHRAEAFWDAREPATPLALRARSQELGRIEDLPPRCWQELDTGLADRLKAVLAETSFVEVMDGSNRTGLLLVQEEGMSHKPSLLFRLSVADILRYWAMLNPDQRLAFLEARAGDMAADPEGAALVTRFAAPTRQETFFDRFAGYFHAFHCLEREVLEQLRAGHEGQATYRLFGRKYDSLGTLLQRAAGADGVEDDVDRYVVFLCARQLCDEVARRAPEFWRAHREDVAALEADLAPGTAARDRLIGHGSGMSEFLAWFDERFLRRARAMEEETA